MSSTNKLPFVDKMSSEEKARILMESDPSYSLLYFNAASVAATARDMLAYGKAKWSNKFPDDEEWVKEKTLTPFGVMPLLTIISADGKEVTIAESIVIDHYLAKRFSLLGDNEWEEFTIKGIYNNIHYLRERSFWKITWTYDDKRKVALESFMKQTLPSFIADHEFHLKANGSNGHYIGNKLSLADLHLVNTMDHFSHLPSGKAITAEFQKSTELMKVKKAVEESPDIAAWRASEEWKKLAEGSITVYAITAVAED